VAEEGVALGEMMDVAARRLNLPTRSITADEARDFYGWIAMFVGEDIPASSAWTRRALGWTPTGPGMLDDLARLAVE
jgi:hypothetical protein